MRIVCISDTHNKHDKLKLPKGDILVHAGDFTMKGSIAEIGAFNYWLKEQDFKYKIVIAGNHDFLFESNSLLAQTLLTNCIYLENTGTYIEGVKFWGSPVTPRFHDWAFNAERGKHISFFWDLIDKDTDFLITHGPPYGIMDRTFRGEDVGCEMLTEKIRNLNIKYHLFGHIHESYGIKNINGTTFINACSLNRKYEIENEPIIIDI
jgi:Icc-related predicted phosphoesterase